MTPSILIAQLGISSWHDPLTLNFTHIAGQIIIYIA